MGGFYTLAGAGWGSSAPTTVPAGQPQHPARPRCPEPGRLLPGARLVGRGGGEPGYALSRLRRQRAPGLHSAGRRRPTGRRHPDERPQWPAVGTPGVGGTRPRPSRWAGSRSAPCSWPAATGVRGFPAAMARTAMWCAGLISGGLALAAVLLGLAAFFARRLSRPLYRLTAAAQALAAGDLSVRVPGGAGARDRQPGRGVQYDGRQPGPAPTSSAGN